MASSNGQKGTGWAYACIAVGDGIGEAQIRLEIGLQLKPLCLSDGQRPSV